MYTLSVKRSRPKLKFADFVFYCYYWRVITETQPSRLAHQQEKLPSHPTNSVMIPRFHPENLPSWRPRPPKFTAEMSFQSIVAYFQNRRKRKSENNLLNTYTTRKRQPSSLTMLGVCGNIAWQSKVIGDPGLWKRGQKWSCRVFWTTNSARQPCWTS